MKQPVLEAVARAFDDEPRPENFGNYRHCCECAEHDKTLRAHSPETIGLDELGKPSWDPMCFATDEGYRYYMPALARLALGSGNDASDDHAETERLAGLQVCPLHTHGVARVAVPHEDTVLAVEILDDEHALLLTAPDRDV